MGPKKVSLTAALAEPPANSPAPPAERVMAASPPRAVPTTVRPRAPAREAKVNVAAWFAPAVKYGLQELALERSRAQGRKVTLQDLMAEAFNDLFKKYGKAETAPSRDG